MGSWHILLALMLVLAVPANARCKRNPAVAHAFMHMTGYPHGRPGYIVDHIKPLACGGLDEVKNMQWQTIEAARLKDKWERLGCKGCGRW